MKRTIALILSMVFLGLLLSGCDRFASTEQESHTPMFQPTPAQTDSPAVPTENSTPSIDTTDPPAAPTENSTSPVETADGSSSDTLSLATFTEFPEGNYLADPKFDTDEFLPDYDADISFLQYESTRFMGLFATEDTIYFAPQGIGSNPSFLYFTDIASGVTMPLCNKPECTHTDNTCNAYLGDNHYFSAIRIYDGKIYWLALDLTDLPCYHLMRMNLDGTDHEIVSTLDYDTTRAIRDLDGCSYVIHRGYLYIGGFHFEATGKTEPFEFTVFAAPLSGGEAFTIMSEVHNCANAIFLIKPVGNDLYIFQNSYRTIDAETAEKMGAFYRWNSKTRKGEYLYGEQTVNSTCQTYFGFTMPCPVPGDGLYYSLYEFSENEYKLMKLSFQTGTLEQIGVFPSEAGGPVFVKDYIICHNSNSIYLFDYNLNLVSQSDSMDSDGLSNFLGANSQFAFYFYIKDDINCMVAIPLHGGDILLLQGETPT